jgi:membrane associated rhomboid family serine protease
MSDAAHNPDDYCYRHPDRLSFVLCERCARTICLECQIHVDGHVFCPDDARAQQISLAPVTSIKRVKRERATSRLLARIPDGMPIVTYSLIGILVLVFLVDTFTGGLLLPVMAYIPGGGLSRPWTLVTSMFAEGGGSSGLLSLFFNGVVIFFVGRIFEGSFGRGKFIALYVVSGLGASVIAFIFNGYVLDAGSATFGLIAAVLILIRRSGGNPIFIYISIGISVLSILLSPARAVLWQGALGGFLGGAAVALTYLFEGNAEQSRQRRLIIGGVVAVLVILALVKALAT